MAKKSERGVRTAAVRDYQSKNPNAAAAEIVAALKEQGITISPAIVYNVRSTAKKSSTSPDQEPVSAAANNSAVDQGSKSKAVRAAIRELGRKTPAKQIVDHLAAKGIKVSLPLVAKAKSRMKARRGGRPAKVAETAPTAQASEQIRIDQLLAAKELADQLGGTDSLRRTLDVLEKLR